MTTKKRSWREELLEKAKRCKKCGGYLESKYKDYHPICDVRE